MKTTLGLFIFLGLSSSQNYSILGMTLKVLIVCAKYLEKTHMKKKIYSFITPRKMFITQMKCIPYIKCFFKKWYYTAYIALLK